MHLQTNNIKNVSAILLGLMLIGCGDSSVESQPPVQIAPDSNVYIGPAPQTEDIQKYKTTLWDNISTSDKCGACHVVDNQSPYFARRDDVNLAYAETTALVNFSKPEDSRLVAKVAGGHNCWLDSDLACAETMTQWIKLWSSDRVSEANTIELKAPVIREAGASKTFPESNQLFTEHVYPLVQTYCANCHAETASNPQSPFFASDDLDQAYENAKRVINIDQPELSRLVVRLGSEFHNCWSDCQQNSREMLTAIEAMSEQIIVDEISADMVVSKALRLTDGTVASSGGRFETDVIALYQFKTGTGTVAYDTSGVTPAANLTLTGNYEWLGSWGINFINAKAQANTASSKKLHDLITATGEFSIEAWLTPNNVVQEGPARIVSYSAGDNDRNFTLGQSQYNYDFMLRTEQTNTNGEPALSTPDAEERLQASLQHVVLTYSATQGRRIYVNGELIEILDEQISPLASWDDSYALLLGKEASNNHTWQGNIRLLAIYNASLESEQIQQNYDVGVGEKYFLLFSIADQVNVANTYIVFEVSQFDNYSYLFAKPSVINLDGNTLMDDIDIEGLHIGINGKESKQGQAFANVSTQILEAQSLTEPLELSSLGTIISIEKGVNSDEFFLSFEKLGDFTNVRIPGEFIAQKLQPADTETADIGIRNFAEIHASMSTLTGISAHEEKVFATYSVIKQQLPSIDNIETFISAQQMAITQLGIAYCDRVIEDVSLRSQWFPNVNFEQVPSSALSATERDKFITPLLDKLMPGQPATQPDKPSVTNELSALIDRLSNCAGSCNVERTKTIAKSSCAAVLASAVTLVQ